MELFANEILKQDNIRFSEINPKIANSGEYLEAIKEEALEKLGYFLKPDELFSAVALRGNSGDDESAAQTSAILYWTTYKKYSLIFS